MGDLEEKAKAIVNLHSHTGASNMALAILSALRAVRAEAIEECAGVADGHKAANPDEWDSADWDQCCERITAAIRALGGKP